MATAEANIQKKIRTGKKVSKSENLENNADILEEKIDAEQIKLSSEEDLESLLKLAEELKEKIDKPIWKIRVLRILQVISIFGLVILIINYRLVLSDIFSSLSLKTFNLIIYITLPIFGEFAIRATKNLSFPDKLALKEVLQLLREVHGTIAEREDWSILKRAEFRIRLSRFDLSEKKDSVFSFFS